MAENESTWMVHFECMECPMTATVVDTVPAWQAWTHHMTSHLNTEGYKAWHWSVVPLPFD